MQLEERDEQRAQEQDEVLRAVLGWVGAGTAPPRAELRNLHPNLLDYRQVFGPQTFKVERGVLYFTRRLNTPGEGGEVMRIGLPPPPLYRFKRGHCVMNMNCQVTGVRIQPSKGWRAGFFSLECLNEFLT